MNSTGFQNIISHILKATPPADSVKYPMHTKSQIASSIYDGCYKANEPRTSVAPPVQLLSPVFGHLLDDVKSSGPIPDDTIRHILDYMRAASAIYASVDKRRVELTPLLCNILGVDIQMIPNEDKTNSDSIAELVTNLGRILLLLKEDKNEFGEGSSGPSIQAGLSVARCWAQSRVIDSHQLSYSFLIVHSFLSLTFHQLPHISYSYCGSVGRDPRCCHHGWCDCPTFDRLHLD
jgi:hypothetical protein